MSECIKCGSGEMEASRDALIGVDVEGHRFGANNQDQKIFLLVLEIDDKGVYGKDECWRKGNK